MRARFVLAILVAAAVAVPAVTTAAPPGLTPSTEPAPAPGPGPARREAIKKRIRALRASTLIDELQLDETTAGKLFPIFGRFDDETEKLLQQRAELQRRLAAANDLKDDKAIDRLLDDAIANQRAFWDLEDKRLAEVRKVLTPAQAARLVVVLPALERKIQNQLRRALQAAKAQNRKGRPHDAPARDDDEDDDEAPAAHPPPRAQPTGSAADRPCDPYGTRQGCR